MLHRNVPASHSQPTSAHLESIKAHYANGVLEIEVPKQKRAEPKRIAVSVN